MCKHSFIKTTGNKTKHVTWMCVHCLVEIKETVIPNDDFLINSYKKIIDEQIEFSQLTKTS